MANTATITVTSAGRGSTHKTLDGSAADAITVNTAAAGGLVDATVKNRSAGDIWFRWDGTTAVAAADGTYHLGAGENYTFSVDGRPVLSVIAGSALAYSVQVAPTEG